jgi:glycosyltransferase involved in cell wall biosynthesis
MAEVKTPAQTPVCPESVNKLTASNLGPQRTANPSLPFVSIVTPVHNEAEHLAECIESVLAQTYQNWDYTIVDNCSTDGSTEIANRYAEKDRRIRVSRNHELLPIIRNHNAALRRISDSSKYCKIVFADDFIFPECIDRMVAVAEDHPSVGIVSAYSLVGEEIKCVGLPYQTTAANGREVCRKHWLERRYLWGSANTLLYRSDLVRKYDPFYNEENIHADDEVCFLLLKTCDFGFVHQVLTFTRVRKDSMTTLSSDMHTECASTLHNLITHGSSFLAPEELKSRIEQHLTLYYRALGKNLLLGRDKSFWNYHKQMLTQVDGGFNRMRVVGGAITVLGSAALNIKDTLGKLRKTREKPSSTQRNAELYERVPPDQTG